MGDDTKQFQKFTNLTMKNFEQRWNLFEDEDLHEEETEQNSEILLKSISAAFTGNVSETTPSYGQQPVVSSNNVKRIDCKGFVHDAISSFQKEDQTSRLP